MSGYQDFYKDFIDADKGVIERTVSYAGRTLTVYFKRITAGQRLKLTPSAQIQNGSMPFSLTDFQLKKYELVKFSNCDAEGNLLFRNVEEVQKLGDQLVDALHKHAAEINKEADEAGKEP